MDGMSLDEYLELVRSPEFRALAEKDSKAAVKRLGIEAGDDMKIEILQDGPDTIHIVMPPRDAGAVQEHDVESVVGGTGCPDAIAPICKDYI